jgi:exodeoxyribonuclease VII large subunit
MPIQSPVFSVSDLAFALKATVEETFGFVRVRGEIGDCKQASSGHWYFTLKDANAVMDSVCWRGTAERLPVRPEEGLEVICSGRLTTYPARSKYQLVVDSLEPAGQGALLALLEQRKAALAKEGLFDSDRKQELPWLPRTIGVITSPTGVVIRDILHRLSDRFPCHVLVYPVLVQGDGAAAQITHAIKTFSTIAIDNPLRPDVLIVARGGGSLEDLWCFNEENVVRAAAHCTIPLISAVGHETDTTLIDFAADRRAPTPTAAAEMAVPVREEILNSIAHALYRLQTAWQREYQRRTDYVRLLSARIASPQRLFEFNQQRVDDLSDRLSKSLNRFLQQKYTQLETLQKLLQTLSYQGVLERGFAFVTDTNGNAIPLRQTAVRQSQLTIHFKDGDLGVTLATAIF